MFDQGFYLSLTLVFCVVGAFGFYIISQSIKNKRRHKKGGYQWQPEQDYDVVMRGETPMTPGFPTLVARQKQNRTSDRK